MKFHHDSIIRRGVIFLFCAIFAAGMSSAAGLKDVEGEYRYYIPYDVSRSKAEQTSLERAMVSALAKEFGIVVSEVSFTDMRHSAESESVDFWSSASTLVKGEWVETIGKPEFTPSIEDGGFVITCRVRGKAREIKGGLPELDIHLFANSTDPSAETSSFMSGDKIYMKFASPVDGYLTVYLEDDSGKVMRMLPFTDSKSTSQKVSSDKEYYFFVSTEGDSEQYRLSTDKRIERNKIFVVFSPNEYIKPIDYSPKEELQLRNLSSAAFRSWVAKLRGADHKLQFIVKPISITGSQE